MQNRAAYNLIFNGLGALLGLTVVGYILFSAFHTETEPPCSQRYPAPMLFALKSGGALLTPIELQAQAGLSEWGIAQNLTVVPEGPAGAALQVKLDRVVDHEAGRDERANGVNFRWMPPGVGAARSACLSYDVWLPEDFPFNDGGILPGILGGKPDTVRDLHGGGFGTRAQWRLDGMIELATAGSGSGYVPANQRNFPLATGRWTRIEQEIVLNAPGAEDGLARMWIDGDFIAESTKLSFRSDTSETIAGVLVDAGYFRDPAKPGILRLSPFSLAWR